MEMLKSGDKVHIDAMEAMRKQHIDMTLEAQKQWMEKFQKEFDAQPENS